MSGSLWFLRRGLRPLGLPLGAFGGARLRCGRSAGGLLRRGAGARIRRGGCRCLDRRGRSGAGFGCGGNSRVRLDRRSGSACPGQGRRALLTRGGHRRRGLAGVRGARARSAAGVPVEQPPDDGDDHHDDDEPDDPIHSRAPLLQATISPPAVTSPPRRRPSTLGPPPFTPQPSGVWGYKPVRVKAGPIPQGERGAPPLRKIFPLFPFNAFVGGFGRDGAIDFDP